MAKRVPEPIELGEINQNPQRNPKVFGEDALGLIYMAGGLAGSGVINDRFVAPLVRGMVPSGQATFAKLADAATTAISAYGLGMLVDYFAPAKVAEDVKLGGLVLAAGKAISVLVPGFSIGASVPLSLAAPAPKALPAADNSANVTRQKIGVATLGI